MPELPEVETVCQGLNRITLAQVILGGKVLRDSTIAHPVSVENFLNGCIGRSIEKWHRRGKYLLARLVDTQSAEEVKTTVKKDLSRSPTQDSRGGWLGVHLRMTGQLLWCNRNDRLQKHTRVRLFFANDRELRFVDVRTFGKMWWIPDSAEPASIMTRLGKLGPEPFWDEFSPDYLAATLHKRRRPIKTALLDQAIVAGVGNIYADETLFLSGVPPTTQCHRLSEEQIDRIRTQLIRVLRDSIAVGGTTFSDFLDVQGVNGNYAGVAWVYGRTGQPCRVCQTPIERIKLGGRSTHFCPSCQPDSELS
ncbi:DNA-formamidopyrimidine glycosylase [Oscillatoriales cyanobacterium LEGE 11467]|uniref:Formamidopyrimidine-DNA glycosylase n=1 Tax=Zarconia navalis LEGE 11467 TaxID=1828826 RepID=A0A928Z5X8_9CYAN|nr:DNA-formamidopyrimidine glycosylase [Zarconia navalis]MBE9039772.1 DNA-formamidopyrimidine glycosylase [Zarconia navalis LEGE 11467]